MISERCNVLMIYPRFNAGSFWNYKATCEMAGARYPAAPLGLITVAALLPKSWDIRLINRNTDTLTDDDLDWAEMVMTGGMHFQQADALQLIELCRARGKPVVVGGPDVTSTPDFYHRANFRASIDRRAAAVDPLRHRRAKEALPAEGRRRRGFRLCAH